jgi:hypothetical protein
MLALTRRELHLLERGTAEEAIGIAEGFRQFEMVVSFGDDELHGFACGFDRRGELAGLALKLRRLEGSVSDDDGRFQFIEMALSA